MRFLIKSAKVIYPGHPLNGKKVDILIKNGKIEEISSNIANKNLQGKRDRLFKARNLHISPGWLDIGATLGEPGEEHKESLESLSSAAIQGGYTGIAPFSNTSIPIDNRSHVDFLVKQSERLEIDIFPIGTLSQGLEGNLISEMHDMRRQGAVAFSDGLKYISDASFLMKALLYAKSVHVPIIHVPGLLDLHGNAQIHESKKSLELGMNGFPSISEEIVLQRDLKLLEYTGSTLVSHLISAADSMMMAQKAAKKMNGCFSSVSALHLYATVEDIDNYNSDYKILPPLRDASDRRTLRNSVRKGDIHFISSNHKPEDPESKDLEFPISEFGSTGLEQAFGAMRAATMEDTELETLIATITTGPRNVLNLPHPDLDTGALANFTLFDPDKKWVFAKEHVRSRSDNNALIGKPLAGKALAVVHRGEFHELG